MINQPHYKIDSRIVYGICPECGSNGYVRERRINGDTICVNGHKHKSESFDKNK